MLGQSTPARGFLGLKSEKEVCVVCVVRGARVCGVRGWRKRGKGEQTPHRRGREFGRGEEVGKEMCACGGRVSHRESRMKWGWDMPGWGVSKTSEAPPN